MGKEGEQSGFNIGKSILILFLVVILFILIFCIIFVLLNYENRTALMSNGENPIENEADFGVGCAELAINERELCYYNLSIQNPINIDLCDKITDESLMIRCMQDRPVLIAGFRGNPGTS